jgi:hypothetical protein
MGGEMLAELGRPARLVGEAEVVAREEARAVLEQVRGRGSRPCSMSGAASSGVSGRSAQSWASVT